MIKFFKPEEEERIINAIREAERNTSGEIRVHLEENCKRNTLAEAYRVFRKLKMHKTEARNGVLIFLAPEKRSLAIVGDKGINEAVPENFWEEEKDLMLQYFRKGEFCEGICQAILQVGEKLKTFFPYQTNDVNELPDDISYG